jgi:hypothetical protein
VFASLEREHPTREQREASRRKREEKKAQKRAEKKAAAKARNKQKQPTALKQARREEARRAAEEAEAKLREERRLRAERREVVAVAAGANVPASHAAATTNDAPDEMEVAAAAGVSAPRSGGLTAGQRITLVGVLVVLAAVVVWRMMHP